MDRAIITAISPGIKAHQYICLKFSSPAVDNKETVRSGPSAAPSVSILRCHPNAPPRSWGGTESAISASRGAVLIPLPVRSRALANSTSDQLDEMPIRGLEIELSKYPITIKGFLLNMRSDQKPEYDFNKLEIDSEIPSIRPTDVMDAPSTEVKKIGVIG